MKKSYWYFLIMLLLMVLLVSCGDDETSDELVIHYNEEYNPFVGQYEELMAHYEDYEAEFDMENFEEAYDITREQITPLLEEMYIDLDHGEWETEEVIELNELLLEEVSYMLDAVAEESEAFELLLNENDEEAANMHLDERNYLYDLADEKAEEYQQLLGGLIERYDIELN